MSGGVLTIPSEVVGAALDDARDDGGSGLGLQDVEGSAGRGGGEAVPGTLGVGAISDGSRREVEIVAAGVAGAQLRLTRLVRYLQHHQTEATESLSTNVIALLRSRKESSWMWLPDRPFVAGPWLVAVSGGLAVGLRARERVLCCKSKE